MPWEIMCCSGQTKKECHRVAGNIADLLQGDFLDEDGLFLCSCGRAGYIPKSFKLQEPGKVWKPKLKGIIKLGYEDSTYQPFVFLAGDTLEDGITMAWFCYYKDLRAKGGNLKMGHGPGGPPVLDIKQVGVVYERLMKFSK